MCTLRLYVRGSLPVRAFVQLGQQDGGFFLALVISQHAARISMSRQKMGGPADGSR